MPEKYQNAPDLPEWQQWYYLAFLDLSTERSGMGDGPIRWSAICSWAEKHCIVDDGDFELFKWIIQGIDMDYLKHQAEKQKRGSMGKGGPKPNEPSKGLVERPQNPLRAAKRRRR